MQKVGKLAARPSQPILTGYQDDVLNELEREEQKIESSPTTEIVDQLGEDQDSFEGEKEKCSHSMEPVDEQ